jgi:hypothetical protein
MEIICMSDLNVVLHTSISQHSEPGAARRLAGSVVPRSLISPAEREEMYGLFETYFSGTSRHTFACDLAEKETVFLLRDSLSGQIQGFSTSMRLSALVDNQEVVAFFSGDTIIARDYWGDTLLSRLWSQTVFAQADLITLARPGTRVYWYLICSGYRTFRFLPVFFREYWPNMNLPTPSYQQKILDTLGKQKYGDQYLEGIVRLASATPLRGGVSDVTEQRLTDAQVAFFVHKNPGHLHGDELACITEITRSNLTKAGQRMVSSPLGN